MNAETQRRGGKNCGEKTNIEFILCLLCVLISASLRLSVHFYPFLPIYGPVALWMDAARNIPARRVKNEEFLPWKALRARPGFRATPDLCAIATLFDVPKSLCDHFRWRGCFSRRLLEPSFGGWAVKDVMTPKEKGGEARRSKLAAPRFISRSRRY